MINKLKYWFWREAYWYSYFSKGSTELTIRFLCRKMNKYKEIVYEK